MADNASSSSAAPVEAAVSTPVPSPAEANASSISSKHNLGVTNSGAAPVEQVLKQADAKIDANPNLTKAQKVQAKQLNRIKLKVDGKEMDETLPFDIPDTPEAREWMTRNLQLSKVSQKRMSEYATLQQQAQTFLDQLRKDPKSVLSDPNIGVDLKKMAASIIEEEIENSQKSPEQLEKEKLQSELKRIKEERENEKKEFERREFDRLTEQEAERYDVQMTKAIEASDIPKSPYVIKKMSDYLLTALQNGVDLTPEEVLPLVREEIQKDIQDMFSVMPEEVIEKVIGKDILNKLRKSSVARAKGEKAKPAAPLKTAIKDAGQVKAKEETPAPKQSFKSFFGV